MEKNEITLSFDSEKMEALVFYLKKRQHYSAEENVRGPATAL